MLFYNTNHGYIKNYQTNHKDMNNETPAMNTLHKDLPSVMRKLNVTMVQNTYVYSLFDPVE